MIDIKADAIQTIYVPCYKGLSIEAILEKGKENPLVAHYLPEERDIHRLPKAFIANVTFTVMKEAFSGWLSEQIKARNDTLAENQDLVIDLDPEIAEAFKSSVNISSK